MPVGVKSLSKSNAETAIMVNVQATKEKQKGRCFMANSLAHTKWVCKYHIVFTPKYRRKIIYNQLRADIRDIIKDLCKWKGVEIIEGHMMPDHVHLLVSVPPKYSISQFMGYLKGKSAMMIFERHANLKYKFGNRNFWATGYYVSTVGINTATVQKYIREYTDYVPYTSYEEEWKKYAAEPDTWYGMLKGIDEEEFAYLNSSLGD